MRLLTRIGAREIGQRRMAQPGVDFIKENLAADGLSADSIPPWLTMVFQSIWAQEPMPRQPISAWGKPYGDAYNFLFELAEGFPMEILEDEEEKSEYDADFGLGDKDLNEEALDDEDDAEKQHDNQRHGVGYIWEGSHKYCGPDQMDDQVGDEIPDGPSEVVYPGLHPHNGHCLPDLLLFFFQQF